MTSGVHFAPGTDLLVMLVTETQATSIAWGIGGTLMAIGVVAWWWLRREERRGAAVCLLLVFAGYAVGISKFANGTRVLVMRGDDRSYLRSDLRLYGTANYVYASGRTEPLRWLESRQIIVNDTPRMLILRTVQYGYGLSSDRPIEPSENHGISGFVEYFGPGDQPPSSVESTGGATRYWLSW